MWSRPGFLAPKFLFLSPLLFQFSQRKKKTIEEEGEGGGGVEEGEEEKEERERRNKEFLKFFSIL